MQIETSYPKLTVTRKSGAERFTQSHETLDLTVLDFWRWACSDLANNSTRGILAEFIVASALGLGDTFRVEWNAFDLLTASGRRIEVKSAAYLQSWSHKKLSAIGFDIRPARGWDAETNLLASDVRRQADIYVFCLLHHQEKGTLDPLNLDQWMFYVLAASVLNERCPAQKRISLSGLRKLSPRVASYNELADCVENARHSTEPGI